MHGRFTILGHPECLRYTSMQHACQCYYSEKAVKLCDHDMFFAFGNDFVREAIELFCSRNRVKKAQHACSHLIAVFRSYRHVGLARC